MNYTTIDIQLFTIQDLSLCPFLRRYAAKYHRSEQNMTTENENRLKAYEWPENVREFNRMKKLGLLSSTVV